MNGAVGSRHRKHRPCVVGLAVGHHLDEFQAGASDPRSDRADRTTQHIGGFVIVHAEHLREYERIATIFAEPSQYVVECHSVRRVDGSERAEAASGDRVAEHRGVAAATALRTAGVIDAHPAGDGQQPAACWTLGSIAVQRAHRPFVDLLGQVVGVAGVTEVPAQLPHVGLGLGHEPFERAPVTVARIEEQPGQVIHCKNILAGGNRFHRTFDLLFVERDDRHSSELACDDALFLLSADADGEASRDERDTLDRHLEGCPGCTSLADRLAIVDRRVRLRPAEAVPDLVMAVTSRVRPAVLGRGGWMRPALAWIAVVLFAQNIMPLVFGETEGAETHLARHLGAFGVAMAIGFAYIAWRPHRSFGMLPFVAALVVSMVASTGFDLADGGRSAAAEATHLTELVGLALLWMIAGSPGWHGWTNIRSRLPLLR